MGACAPVPASSTSTSCYELTACKSLHHAIAFYPRPLHHPIQSATLTEHTFARFLHRHCFQLELRIEVPSLSVSALLLPPSIRYKVQDLFNEFKFKHSFWKLFLVLSFKRVFLREKKRKSRVAAESLGGVQARLESSITKVGRTWSHWHKGLPWFINMFIQCLSRATAITLAHLILRSARNAAGKGQGCPPASRHFCQATICSAGARCRASTYNCSSTHLQYFACFSLFFYVFPYFYKSPV